MGVSTDAILCFGYKVEEGYKFPWSKVGEIYDKSDWLKDNSLTVEHLSFKIIRHCSVDEPYYIVALKAFCAHRGNPQVLMESDFCVDNNLIKEFTDFNAKHNIVPKDIEACWHLCSFMG